MEEALYRTLQAKLALGTFSEERCPDLIRFGHIDTFIDITSMRSGLLANLDKSLASDVEIIVVDTIGSSLLKYAVFLKARASECDAVSVVDGVTNLVEKLASDEMDLPKVIVEELRLLAQLCPAVGTDERGDAVKKLCGLSEDASYAGVLQKLLEHEIWQEFVQEQASSRSVQDRREFVFNG